MTPPRQHAQSSWPHLVGGEDGGAEAVVTGVHHGGGRRVVVVGHLWPRCVWVSEPKAWCSIHPRFQPPLQERTLMMVMTGPKTSSCAIFIPFVTSASTVGRKKLPRGCARLGVPPTRSLAPARTASSTSSCRAVPCVDSVGYIRHKTTNMNESARTWAQIDRQTDQQTHLPARSRAGAA